MLGKSLQVRVGRIDQAVVLLLGQTHVVGNIELMPVPVRVGMGDVLEMIVRDLERGWTSKRGSPLHFAPDRLSGKQ